MNKFDDFLKSKMSEASFEVPSNWDALDKVLPAKPAGRGILKWAFAILLLGSLATTAVVLNKNTHSINTANNSTRGEVQSNNGNSASKSPATPGEVTNAYVESPMVVNNGNHNSSSTTHRTAPKTPLEAAVNSQVVQSTPDPVNENTAPQSNAVTSQDQPVIPAENKKETSLLNKENNSKVTKPAVRPSKKSRSDFHEGKLYVSLSFSPMLSYRSFQLNNGAAPFVNKQYDEIRQNAESKIISYGSALSLEYKFIKNFSLQGGISYNVIGFQSNYDFEVSEKATTDNTGRVIGYEYIQKPYSVSFDNKTKIEVLRIPFGLNYNLYMTSNSLFHFYFGASHNILLAAQGEGINSLTLEKKSITKADYTRSANEVCVDLGLNIALTSRYAFGVDLYYNKWLTNISRSKYENITPFTAGLNLAISRKIY